MPATIQVDEPTKDRLKSFGVEGETYRITNCLYDVAVQHRLRELLMS